MAIGVLAGEELGSTAFLAGVRLMFCMSCGTKAAHQMREQVQGLVVQRVLNLLHAGVVPDTQAGGEPGLEQPPHRAAAEVQAQVPQRVIRHRMGRDSPRSRPILPTQRPRPVSPPQGTILYASLRPNTPSCRQTSKTASRAAVQPESLRRCNAKQAPAQPLTGSPRAYRRCCSAPPPAGPSSDSPGHRYAVAWASGNTCRRSAT